MTRAAWGFIGSGSCLATVVFLLACSPATHGEVRATPLAERAAPAQAMDKQPSPTSFNAPLAVQKTQGCGVPATQELGAFVKYSLVTSGAKAADCAAKDKDSKSVCGPWSVTRDYYVWLPVGYDSNRAYPLVFQGPGCGGSGTDVYTLGGSQGPGVGGNVIRVGLTPPPASVGHGTNPNQGCFDDKEGDDSVDFVFYERLRDTLKNQLCYDENRVFAVGNSSGSWLANELGCKYAGDTRGYALRGIVANTGGLPTETAFRPTCSNAPLSGMWIQELGDPVNLFSGNVVAIDRAMTVNGCSNTRYESAELVNYPIGGGNPDSTCKRIQGCPEPYPLVVCALAGNAHAPHDSVVNPAASTFLSGFLESPPQPVAAPAPEPSGAEPEGTGRLGTGDRFDHVPAVRMGDVSLHSGEADPQLVRRVVRTMLGAQRLCYERALSKQPALQGNLSLRLTINAEGTTTKVEKLGGTIANKDFIGCVQNAFTHLTLGTGHDLVVDVPMLFAP